MLLSDSIKKTYSHLFNKSLTKKAKNTSQFTTFINNFSLLHLYNIYYK